MASASEQLLRRTKGSLAETPLPVLLQAICLARRSCGLQLKRLGLEKTIVFDGGVPVECRSNLAHESLGRLLVAKGVLTEDQHLKVLSACAKAGRSFEEMLLRNRILEESALLKHRQAALAQSILDCFQWTDAQYRLLGVELPEAPLRMGVAQLIYTGVSTVYPPAQLQSQLPLPPERRFACVHAPPHRLEELKLSEQDAGVVDLLLRRPTVGELLAGGLEPQALARVLYVLFVLGFIDDADKVPEQPPAPPAPAPSPVAAQPAAAAPVPAPAAQVQAAERPIWEEPKPRSKWPAIAAAAVALIAVGGGYFLWSGRSPAASAPQPPQAANPAPTQAARPKPSGQRSALTVAPLLAAPAGSTPQPDRERGLFLSAAGIPIELPRPLRAQTSALIASGNQLLGRGKAFEALAIYERAAGQDPSDAEPLYGAALSQYLLGRDGEASKLAGQALAAEAKHASASLLLGYLELLAAHEAEARAHFAACLASAPDSAAAADVRQIVAQLREKP